MNNNFFLQTNNNNKSETNEDYVHTPMSSTHQFITSKVSINMAPLTNSSSIINENTKLVSHVPQYGNIISL